MVSSVIPWNEGPGGHDVPDGQYMLFWKDGGNCRIFMCNQRGDGQTAAMISFFQGDYVMIKQNCQDKEAGGESLDYIYTIKAMNNNVPPRSRAKRAIAGEPNSELITIEEYEVFAQQAKATATADSQPQSARLSKRISRYLP